jgi:hypothetical protein
MPAAVQRRRMSPSRQRLTLRWVRRTVEIIDSIGFVEQSVRLSAPLTPGAGEGERLLEVLAQRPGGVRVRRVERARERLERGQRRRVVGVGPCLAQQRAPTGAAARAGGRRRCAPCGAYADVLRGAEAAARVPPGRPHGRRPVTGIAFIAPM